MSEENPPPDAPAVLATEGGRVTLVDLATLRSRALALQNEVDTLTASGRSLRSLAEGLWVDRGKLLVHRSGDWIATPPIADLVLKASPLEQRVENDDAKVSSIKGADHHGVSGLFGRVSDWGEGRKASADQAKAELELRPLLLQIGRSAPNGTLPDADSLLSQAIAADTQAQQIESQAAEKSAAGRLVKEELTQRREAEQEMGFDAPYLAASLQARGPAPIQSPLILKRGEMAALAVAATLARQTTRRQWVGGSQGFSFPIGHTGIRYRVGSFRGHPVEEQLLTRLDNGTLVVTNQRLAFIGSTKSTSAPFAKLLHVECYSDALAIFLEGREKPDYYYVEQPKYVLFFINWFLNQVAG